jgi:hypothetical protein
VVLVYEQTILTERPPFVGKVSAKFVHTECSVVSAMNPRGRILGFLDRSRYFFFQVTPQLYSWGWVDPITGPLLLAEPAQNYRVWLNGLRTADVMHMRTYTQPIIHVLCSSLHNQWRHALLLTPNRSRVMIASLAPQSVTLPSLGLLYSTELKMSRKNFSEYWYKKWIWFRLSIVK